VDLPVGRYQKFRADYQHLAKQCPYFTFLNSCTRNSQSVKYSQIMYLNNTQILKDLKF